MNSRIITGCKYIVITSCSYLWLGVENIIRQQGGQPVRMTADAVSRYEGIDFRVQDEHPIQLSVFLTGDLCNRLAICKKLVVQLNCLPKNCDVTVFSHLPAVWLYVMLRALVHNAGALKKIRYCHQRPTPGSLISAHFPHLEDIISVEELAGVPSGAGLSSTELDAVLNYYQGRTVSSLSRRSGVAEKTIYAHRKSGLKKLACMQEWLNDTTLTRKMCRSR